MLTLAFSVCLSAVFAVAGFAKLANRSQAATALVQFGVARSLAGPSALALAAAELACATALLFPETARAGAVAASALLTIFTLVIAVTLIRGRRPACHCFGQMSAKPISGRTVARNLILLAASLAVASAGPAQVDMRPFAAISVAPPASVAFALAAITLGGLVVMGGTIYLLLQQNGRLLVRLEAIEARLGIRAEDSTAQTGAGLPVGSPAPDFRLRSTNGVDVSLTNLRHAGLPVLLVFSGADCGACDALLPEIGEWQADLASRLAVAVISREGNTGGMSLGTRHIENVLPTTENRVWDAYQVQATPSAVLVKDGLIASPVTTGGDAIRALVDAQRLAVMPGDPLPSLALPDLDGQPIEVSARRGLRTLLLFWNPSCGFCQRMLGDITAWERQREPGATALLVISAGSAEENRRLGFRSPVLLDDAFRLGRVLGVGGTPAAILADEYGRIASGIGTGADAVFKLATSQSLTTSSIR